MNFVPSESNKSELFSIIVSVSVARISSILISGLMLLLISYSVPPETFGRFNLFIALIQTVSAVFLNWPNQGFLRHSREEIYKCSSIRNTWGSRLLINVFMSSFLLFFVWFFHSELEGEFEFKTLHFGFMVFITAVIFSTNDLFLVLAQATGRSILHGTAPLVQKSVLLLLLYLLISNVSPRVEMLIVLLIISYLVAIAYSVHRINWNLVKLSWSISSLRALLSFSWIMPVSLVGVILLNTADYWFIKHYHGTYSVGQYSWSFSIVLMLASFLVPITAAIAPKIIDLEVDDMKSGLATYTDAVIGVALFISTILAALMPVVYLFLNSVIGTNFKISIGYLVVLSCSFPAQIILSLLGPVVYSNQRLVKHMCLIVSFMLLIKVTCNLLFLESLGVYVSALATVFSYTLGMLWTWAVVRHSLNKTLKGIEPVLFLLLFSVCSAILTVVSMDWKTVWLCLPFGFLFLLFRHLSLFSCMPEQLALFITNDGYKWLTKT